MPVIFAQPDNYSFNSRSSGGGGGGGNLDSSALADIAAYKAQYADRAFNAEAQQQANITGAQLQTHAAMQERAAELSIQNWVQQQAFTQQDQQELARQQNVVSELQSKLDKGEITDKEFYQTAGERAKRINLLTFKEQHTKNQMLNDQRKARAELLDENQKQIRLKNQLLGGELEDRIDTFIPDDQKGILSRHMQIVAPELKPGTTEYDAKMKLEASEMGIGVKMVKMPDGKLVGLDTLMAKAGLKQTAEAKPGAAPSESGDATPIDYKAEHEMYKTSYDRALAHLTKKDEHGHDIKPEPTAVKALAEQMMRDEMTFHQQRREERAGKTPGGVVQSGLKNADAQVETIQQRQDISPGQQAAAITRINAAKEIMQHIQATPGKKPTRALQARLAMLKQQVDAILSSPPVTAPPSGPIIPENMRQQQAATPPVQQE